MQNAKQEELFEEVEVVDDADKEEKGSSTENQTVGDTQTTTENQQELVADDDDLSEYSDSVKKRISKLTNRFREEERQRKAAIDYAESIKRQNEDGTIESHTRTWRCTRDVSANSRASQALHSHDAQGYKR